MEKHTTCPTCNDQHNRAVIDRLEEIVRLLKEQNNVATVPYYPYYPQYNHPTVPGYRCPNCGTWVSGLMAHNCHYYQPYSPVWSLSQSVQCGSNDFVPTTGYCQVLGDSLDNQCGGML